ncbi:MAG: hypothetical protein HRU38_18885 [Saccharospirillaceae bacterium]|nr:hypothetical protein [Pseudomonadales bacterium]NRB80701.1 hypothetical protein [Saccharospirillaceae bacterium]
MKLLFGLMSVLVFLFVIFFNLFNYELTVSNSDDGVIIQVLSLGEYHSPVLELEISDSNNIVVVKLKTKSNNSVLHTVLINEGVTKFDDIYLDQYEVVYPQSQIYKFIKHEQYNISVKWKFNNAQSTFIL